MTNYAHRYVGIDTFPSKLPEFDLEQYFHLSDVEVAALADRFSHDHRAPAAILLLSLRVTGFPFDRFATIPRNLLRYVGERLGVPVPTIASLKTVYQRRQTLYVHQVWAKEFLGLKDVDQATSNELEAFLAATANEAVSTDELVTVAQCWLFDRKFLLPGDRQIRDLARRCYEHVERGISEMVRTVVGESTLAKCRDAVYQIRAGTSTTVLEWLKTPPKKHSPSTMKETFEKITFLKNLGTHDWAFDTVPVEKQRGYAQRIQSRRPSMSKRVKDESLTVEIAFFLRITLLELTDSAVFQAGRRVSDLMNAAFKSTQAKQARTGIVDRKSLVTMKALWEDKSLSDADYRRMTGEILAMVETKSSSSHAAHVRETLISDEERIRPLLHSLDHLTLEGSADHKHLANLNKLHEFYKGKVTELPTDEEFRVDRSWQELVDDPDRTRAFRALEAATMQGLRRSLRNGSIWIPHSLACRGWDQTLIPREEWERDRERHSTLLGIPLKADDFMTPLLWGIRFSLEKFAEAKGKGLVEVDPDGTIRLPKLSPLEEDAVPKKTLELMFKEIGDVQFPDLMLEVDAHTNFSEVLLGHRAKDEHELVALYAALIAHGTEIDAKGVAAMIPQLEAGHVSNAMRGLETPGRLRRANDQVVEFQMKHAIASLWGTGKKASSDMMSLDVSRHLLHARLEPRRKSQAVGIYTHVLDQYGVIHDTPIVLNERQAGVAIVGAEYYNTIEGRTRISQLATDTHGYTNAAIAIAKGLGFDLCPHLRNLSERKLFLPRNYDVPQELDACVVREISMSAIREGWDDYLRVVASIRSGRVTADIVLQRLGSAAQSDPFHKAVDHLGRLLRTLFLCDYFSNPSFRREIRSVLNRGESVHSLQRVVYYGKVPADRGRRSDEMIAISGSHALLTNLVIAWNTMKMQEVVDRWRKTGRPIEDAWLRRMGPGHYANINFRGTFRFGVDRYAGMLLQRAGQSRQRRSA